VWVKGKGVELRSKSYQRKTRTRGGRAKKLEGQRRGEPVETRYALGEKEGTSCVKSHSRAAEDTKYM